MKKFVVCAVLAAGLMVGSADAATLFLANAADGTGSMTLGGGESGTINIMLDTDVSDGGVAFLNTFLDLDSAVCDTDVTAVTPGQSDPQWTYDRSAFKLPAELDDACDGDGDEINEYGLVMGSSAGPGFPAFTDALYVMDSITVTHDGSDTHTDGLYFESGARKPQAFGPPPTYTPFTTNDFSCFPIPTLLNMGVGNYTAGCADAFDISKTPEPTAVALLALGGLVALRRRR